MDKIKDIKQDLINEIMDIEDINALNALYQTLEHGKKASERIISEKIDEATIEVRRGWTLDQIVSEQNIDQITYPEITEIVENMDWEISLEELLASID